MLQTQYCMKYINQNGQKVVALGALDLQIKFTIPGDNTVYTTLTYPRSLVNYEIGNRYCINETTLKSESIPCSKKVIPVGQGAELFHVKRDY